MKMNLIFLLLLLCLLISYIYTDSSTDKRGKPDNLNGFYPDTLNFDIVNYSGRQNVLKVNGADTQWAIVKYPLTDYKGQEIVIHFSADVRRTGARGNLNWQVNNENEGYPSVSYLENAATGVWHHMKGRRIIVPNNNEPVLYLTNWENNAQRTTYYIANPTVTIEPGGFNPDFTLRPLKSRYQNNFLIGNIAGSYNINDRYFELIKHHYNIVTTTDTYPFSLAPSGKGIYQWERADNVVNLMRRNNIPVHGHVLVWHEDCPKWMTSGSRETVIANLQQYITDVLAHFKGRINSWDVVNEAMADNLTAANAAGDWRRCVRRNQNPWFNALGADYIEIAFRAARAADPDITLYYNDFFHYEWTNESWVGGVHKVEAVRKMIDDINTRYKNETGGTRNLIEGVGSQSHFMEPTINFDNVRLTLEKLKTLGIDIVISELDISMAGFVRGEANDTAMSLEDEIAQAVLYAKLFQIYREYAPYISRVVMWGADDGTSWLSAGNPCLFDWRLNAKRAFHAASDPAGFLAQH